MCYLEVEEDDVFFVGVVLLVMFRNVVSVGLGVGGWC